jgi:predicted solute-binding protein
LQQQNYPQAQQVAATGDIYSYRIYKIRQVAATGDIYSFRIYKIRRIQYPQAQQVAATAESGHGDILPP